MRSRLGFVPNVLRDLVFVTHFRVGTRPLEFILESRCVILCTKICTYGEGGSARYDMEADLQHEFCPVEFDRELQQKCCRGLSACYSDCTTLTVACLWCLGSDGRAVPGGRLGAGRVRAP